MQGADQETWGWGVSDTLVIEGPLDLFNSVPSSGMTYTEKQVNAIAVF